MNKVYIVYECYCGYYDCNEEHRTVMKVFDCEEKAKAWVDKRDRRETGYRMYDEWEVE